MRSMVTTKEMMLNSQTQTVSTNITSSEPHVLLTETNNSRGQDSRAPCDNRMNTRPFEPQVGNVRNVNSHVASPSYNELKRTCALRRG
ncbi:hypothetical protein Tco_0241233 [Tanacetum coccineum]